MYFMNFQNNISEVIFIFVSFCMYFPQSPAWTSHEYYSFGDVQSLVDVWTATCPHPSFCLPYYPPKYILRSPHLAALHNTFNEMLIFNTEPTDLNDFIMVVMGLILGRSCIGQPTGGQKSISDIVNSFIFTIKFTRIDRS